MWIEVWEEYKLAQAFIVLGDGGKWGNSSVGHMAMSCILQMDLGLLRLLKYG